MSAFDDRTSLGTVNCPNGHPVRITLGQVRRSQTVRCPGCSASIAMNGRDVDQKMRNIDREWDKLQRTIKNFGR